MPRITPLVPARGVARGLMKPLPMSIKPEPRLLSLSSCLGLPANLSLWTLYCVCSGVPGWRNILLEPELACQGTPITSSLCIYPGSPMEKQSIGSIVSMTISQKQQVFPWASQATVSKFQKRCRVFKCISGCSFNIC